MEAEEVLQRYAAGQRNFCGINLQGIHMRGVHLRGVNLSWADLSRASLMDVNLNEADLRGTCLKESFLILANLTQKVFKLEYPAPVYQFYFYL
ncbi:pentapeptide repeat-containing protein [Nostoc sp.]|uniref:pentapeptide repeat-containing protein n=1 Tax=Nostoc sp. TaxID=1180 RepID=UPI002FFB4B44